MLRETENLLKNIPDLKVKKAVSFCALTTFKNGGIAPLVVYPNSAPQLQAVIGILRACFVPYVILGNGSNCLAQDGIFCGVVVRINRNLSGFSFNGNCAEVLAGTLISQLSLSAQRRGLSGLEFARSLPACVGGAVAGNCGCFGQEIAQIVRYVDATNGIETVRFTQSQCGFSYRNSVFGANGYVIAKVGIELNPSTVELVERKSTEITLAKRATQPLSYPSAGSVFKRDGDVIPPLLIEECGLKGARCGGAVISTKHCGFIVSEFSATSADVVTLINLIKQTVYDRYKINLNREIRYIGEVDDYCRPSHTYTIQRR